MKKIIEGKVYDTEQSTRISDYLQSSDYSWPSQRTSVWKTAAGGYFELRERLSGVLKRQLGDFDIKPLSKDDAYNTLHGQQQIDALRKEFPDRVAEA